MSFLGFLTQKKFYINLGVAVIVTIIILVFIASFLKVYTRHGQTYIIPDLTGLTIRDRKMVEASARFNLQITDSIFDNSLLPGSVIQQNPSPGSKSKAGRNIYITVVSIIPKMSIMPELKDLTVRQAVTTLKSTGLHIRRLIFTDYFAENSVLGQYHGRDTLVAGTKILEGSYIDLLVGLGKNQKAKVPFVIGLTQDQAHEALQIASFNFGKEFFMDNQNSMHSRVFRQDPVWNDQIFPGDSVTLYYRSDLHFNFDSLRRQINPDTAVIMQVPSDLEEDSTELEQE